MPNAYHLGFFAVWDGVSDDKVIGTFRKYRELAVGKGYVRNASDITLGKVEIPAGGADDVARARAMTGGFTWAFSVRLDGRDGLARYIKESPADVRAYSATA